jgi:hypothetical protein
MEPKKKDITEEGGKGDHRYLDYSEFWRVSMEKIEDIQSKLNVAVKELEKKYSGFDKIYDLIEEELNTLSSIYSSYNSIHGGSHIMKLNTLIREYKRRYTRDGIDFDLIHFLLRKIGELRDRSVEDFPLLQHREDVKGEPVYREVEEKKEYLHSPYKWITYEKNRSWFISQFSELLIVNEGDTEEKVHIDDEHIRFRYRNGTYTAFDHFGSTTTDTTETKFYIIIDNGEKVYAASTAGKRLYAKKDLMKGKVEPFRYPHLTKLYSGYVRVFGKRHILVV